MASTDESGADPFESAWKTLESRWDDDDAHRRFVGFCFERRALAEAGRRYRHVQEHDPARRERATRQLTAVQGAAWIGLEATRQPAPKQKGRLAWAVGGVCLVLSGYGILSVLRLFAR